jgi:hypothetical protein
MSVSFFYSPTIFTADEEAIATLKPFFISLQQQKERGTLIACPVAAMSENPTHAEIKALL